MRYACTSSTTKGKKKIAYLIKSKLAKTLNGISNQSRSTTLEQSDDPRLDANGTTAVNGLETSYSIRELLWIRLSIALDEIERGHDPVSQTTAEDTTYIGF